MINREASREAGKAVKNQTIGYIAGAFGLVAGLAWNDAIKALIDMLFPLDKSGVWIKFAYAVLITILVVVVTKYLLSTSDNAENK